MSRSVCFAAAIAALLLALPAAAQMYRCGNAYQDRPCEGEPGKVIGSGSPSSSSSGSYAECNLRGEKAQKISWIRETGVMEEKQLASAKSYADKKLIQEVYQRRGTAVEIRAAVEADCRDEKDRAAQAAGLRSLANQISPPQAVGAPLQRGSH